VNPSVITVRIRCPQDAIAVLPHLLGFHPSPGSLAVITCTASRITLTLRYDIPPADQAADLTEHLVGVLASQYVDEVIVIGYGPAARVTPILTATRDALAGLVTVHEILRVTGGRWWSLMCQDPSCCPPEGTACDSAATIAAAQLTGHGSVPLPTRESLAATIAPVTGPVARKMREATRRAERTAIRLITRDDPRALWKSGLAAVQRAISAYRAGGAISPDARHAWLALVLTQLPVRDDAWARMDSGHRDAHLRLWTDVVRHAQPGYVAAPASLLAFTAWQDGNGVLANVALDRALEDDPDYSLALLFREAVNGCLPPFMARAPLTPEEVAASYAQPGDGDHPDAAAD
jgi:hypothetical protein